MPLYDYKCKNCKQVETIKHGYCNPTSPLKCKKCGGELEKQISIPYVSFKGSGFAKNDLSKERIALEKGKSVEEFNK